MPHVSVNSTRLVIRETKVTNQTDISDHIRDFGDVCLLRLPSRPIGGSDRQLWVLGDLVDRVIKTLGPEATLITLGDIPDLVHVHAAVTGSMQYQLLIAIKTPVHASLALAVLPGHHFGALVHTRYRGSLQHAKTRVAYTYCPECGRTTKDYGGKKHTYHYYGTLMSDVWRDIECDPDGDLAAVLERFADLFGLGRYHELRVLDCRSVGLQALPTESDQPARARWSAGDPHGLDSMLLRGDCLEHLARMPAESVDFAFADPPYNLNKMYAGYADDLAIARYFDWCDKWIRELARILRPGRTCAVINLPLWAIRHFLYMETILEFQSWIVWDALSFPVRMIMPSHYPILCFSKGTPRPLPGLTSGAQELLDIRPICADRFLQPLAEGYCLRADCVAARKARRANDRGPLTDLWWDVHRLKHNSRRVDHPCQLPPQLMYRLIALYTEPGEVVLDSFDGAGTTTLAAHQLGRRYIGIELLEEYHGLAVARHKDMDCGMDPFRKADRPLTAKNSPVPRMPKRKYAVPKKTLQLEVRRVAQEIGRLPTHEDMIRLGKYPIGYYDQYFASWGEVCAAARTTGMSEYPAKDTNAATAEQLRLLEAGKEY